MASKHICPNCGCKEFTTVAHISQDWKVDESGNFIAVQESYLETVAHPDDDNIWTCVNCGAEAEIVKTL